MKKLSILLSPFTFAATLIIAAPSVSAHSDEHVKKHDGTPLSTLEHSFGRQGNPKQVSRTIILDMNDSMRFTPSEIKVKQGETIKFIVRNKGRVRHEMVLGSLDDLKAHGEMMKNHPDMAHSDPYMAHVKPGGEEDMVWQFTKAGAFNFGCLAPGHFEAGMIGKIIVTKG